VVAGPRFIGRGPRARFSTKMASESFQRLKQALPEIVDQWCKQAFGGDRVAEVPVARQIGEAQAKITIEVWSRTGNRNPWNTHSVVLFLQHFRGTWTMTRTNATWGEDDDQWRKITHLLTRAVDKAGEK
jgi:hypothetical protein